MDSNIEKIRTLLEEGYKVIQIQLMWETKDGQGIMENTVTLKRGQNTEVVHSVNSPEFFEFIKHFKRAKDKYDNDEFVYVKDLDLYNSIMKQHEDQPILREHHKLRISGREFSKGILTLYLKLSGGTKIERLGYFYIDLDMNPGFVNVDFKDEIEVYDMSNKIVLRGLIKNYELSDQNGFILVQDLSLKMQHVRVSVEFNEMNHVDCVGLLTEASGFSFKPHGWKYNTNERDFTIIVPVMNLIVDQSFKIGNVEFYQDFNSLNDALIRKSGTGRSNSSWNGNIPRAKVIVKAKQFYEAIMKGYSTISKAIDVITLRTDISFVAPTISNDVKRFHFSYYKYLSRVKIPTWVYCRENNSEAHTFFNLETVIENVLSLEVGKQSYFDDINALCSDLITNENRTVDENNMIHALHWLRKSVQEGGNKDKFIDLWIAFEFLLSGIKPEKIFSNGQIAELQEMIKGLDENKYDTTRKNAIESKIKMLNDAPLMEKFNQLRGQLKIDLSDWELGILTTARRKRTDLIHGKNDVEIEEDELNKMRTILERMLITKINLLGSPGGAESTKANL